MCFSATTSFVAGSLLCGAGLTTLHMARTRRELPLAAMPLIFGVQQIAEGFVWNSGVTSARVPLDAAGYVFLFVALVLWPTFVPIAALLIEPQRWRRRALAGIGLVGLGVSCYLGYGLVTHAAIMHTSGQRLEYHLEGFSASIVEPEYFIAACVSCLLSSHRTLQVFGLLAVVLGYAAEQVNIHAFVSVWCFFGAILSMVLVTHFAQARRPAWHLDRA